MAVTLLSRHNPLSSSLEQLKVLADTGSRLPFESKLNQAGLFPFHATGIRLMQINVGKLCNQTCGHCHVDAGPDRKEIMSRETAEQCVRALSKTDIPTVDITGGAPELNANFRWLVEQFRGLGRHVIDRSNLSVLLLPSQADLAEFLAHHHVEIIASLPCYCQDNVDQQRGKGVFEKSIAALKQLNALGYGYPDSDLTLNLVYNPQGPNLPPNQTQLEFDYKRELKEHFDIEFNRLYTITNMPISRFLEFLVETENYEQYMTRLTDAFNPSAATGVMCRSMISVGWDGTLYDCDFNQMLSLPVNEQTPCHIRDFDPARLGTRRIVMGNHCYGCTAGAGSSCEGAVMTATPTQ